VSRLEAASSDAAFLLQKLAPLSLIPAIVTSFQSIFLPAKIFTCSDPMNLLICKQF
jgi:hypothetical protein